MGQPKKQQVMGGSLTFGQRVKKARLAARLTLREAADRLGAVGEGRVSHQAIQNWEADRTATPMWRIPQIAKIYSCSQAFLMGQEDSLGEPVVPTETMEKIRTSLLMLETVLDEEGLEMDPKRKSDLFVLILRQEPDEGYIRDLVRLAS